VDKHRTAFAVAKLKLGPHMHACNLRDLALIPIELNRELQQRSVA